MLQDAGAVGIDDVVGVSEIARQRRVGPVKDRPALRAVVGVPERQTSGAVALERSNRPSARAGKSCGDGSTQVIGK
jgi:hypothetical protein